MADGGEDNGRWRALPPYPYLPPVSTKVMRFPLWSVALDTCNSESVCMCLCANGAAGGQEEKAGGQDGEGQEAKDRSVQPQDEEGTMNAESGRSH